MSSACAGKQGSHGARPELAGRMAGFAELGLSSWLVEQCRQLGLKQPTPVQLGCIPAILEGKCGPASSPGSLPTLSAPLPSRLSLCQTHFCEARGTLGRYGRAWVPKVDWAVLAFGIHS